MDKSKSKAAAESASASKARKAKGSVPAAVKRGKRKTRVGVVVGNKTDKTAVVAVESQFRHALYHKIVKKTKKFVVHDEENKAGIGDTVEIMETRPLSKLKRWRLVGIVEKSK